MERWSRPFTGDAAQGIADMATAKRTRFGLRGVTLGLAGWTLALPLVFAAAEDYVGPIITPGPSAQAPSAASGSQSQTAKPQPTQPATAATPAAAPVDVTETPRPKAVPAPRRLPAAAKPLAPKAVSPVKGATTGTRVPTPPPGLSASGQRTSAPTADRHSQTVVPVSGKQPAGPSAAGSTAQADAARPASNDPYQRPSGLRPLPTATSPLGGPVISPAPSAAPASQAPLDSVKPQSVPPTTGATPPRAIPANGQPPAIKAAPTPGQVAPSSNTPSLLPPPAGLDVSDIPAVAQPKPGTPGQPAAPVAERLLLAPNDQPRLIEAQPAEEMLLLEEPASDVGESLDLTPEPTTPNRIPTPPTATPQPVTPDSVAPAADAAPKSPVDLDDDDDDDDDTPAAERTPAPRKLPLLEYLRQGESNPATATPPKSLAAPDANPAPVPAKPAPALPRLEVEAGDSPTPLQQPANAASPTPTLTPSPAPGKSGTAPSLETPVATEPKPATPVPATPTLAAPAPQLTPVLEPAVKELPSPPALTPAAPVASGDSTPGDAAAATKPHGPKPVPGLVAPEGFEVTEFAGDGLAHDIYSLTVDAHGRVVVAGPGYIKILIDSDHDGRADRARLFSSLPANGAQGLCFVGNDLLCTGDEGLLRFRDANGDGKADAAPELFLKIETGGEHNAHAIRRGPDGWWYLIAGNTTGVDSRYASLPTSPVKSPHGGVILRLPPDLSGGEVYADGFRNAYDFAFGPLGDLFVHDSDGERDMSLPWYMPTRLFHVLPGSSQGWISDSWKLPNHFLDAAPVVAETGRASPTGIVSYRHTQFPEKYRSGLFLLDWTFGRIQYAPANPKGETYTGAVEDFLKTSGEFGFAPTDAEVGPDGSLYVCVGGRGTHGTVYRVRYVGADGKAQPEPWTSPESDATPEQLAAYCLAAPQPASSWSRNHWVPRARKAGQTAFLNIAMAEEKPVAERLRAIEILTELHGGLPTTALEILAAARAPQVRAHAIWSASVVTDSAFNANVCMPYLGDADPRVRLKAVHTLARHPKLAAGLVPQIGKLLGDQSHLVRMATIRLFPDLESPVMKEIAETGRKQNWQSAITAALAYTWRQQSRNFGVQTYGVEVGRRVLESRVSPELKREAARLLQVSLGDLGSLEAHPPVFDGYISPVDLTPHERELDALTVTLAKVFPTGDALLDYELARVIAMVGPANPDLLEKLLAKITPESHPTDDVHFLLAAARVPAERGEAQRDKIAQTLVDLDAKVATRGLWIDTNWSERIGELYARHVELDEELAARMIPQKGFGRPAHVLFLAKVPAEEVPNAVAAFAREMDANPDYGWNNDTVFTLGFGKEEQYYERVRKQADRYDLRMSAVMVLSESPKEEDRIRFARGLDLDPPEVIAACLTGLETLPAKDDPGVTARLVKFLRRIAADESRAEARSRALAILARDTKQSFGEMSSDATPAARKEIIEKWTAWVTTTHPQAAAESLGTPEADLKSLESLMARTDWTTANLAHGKKLYVERGCAQCHAGGRGLGPDLAGITGRFSREDLFVAIHLPNRDVSPRYQTLMVETKSGKTYTGLIVYEDTDGIMLRNSTNQTQRIEAAEIEGKQALSTSLMPMGLLKDLQPQDLSDLYAYLKTLGAAPIAAAPSPDTEKK